ncbi:type II secretion system F family protein [Halanaerocella petrolearia]
MFFHYQAIRDNGDKLEGRIKAETRKEVIKKLKAKNYYVVKVGQDNKLRAGNWLTSLKSVSSQELALFSRQFATLLNAGLPLVSILTVLEEQLIDNQLQEIISEVNQEVQAGRGLANSLSQYNNLFPELMINLISIGEDRGILDKILEQLATYFEMQAELKQQLRSVLTYPLILIVTSIAIIIFLVTFIVPTFTTVFASYGLKLPWVTRSLLKIVDFIKINWELLLLSNLFIIISLTIYYKTEKGHWQLDYIVLHCPVIGKLLNKRLIIRFSQILGVILKGGSDLLAGLKSLQKASNNQVLKKRLDKLQTGVEQGQSLSSLLIGDDFYPQLLIQMVKVGEKTGDLEGMLLEVADYYRQDLEYDLERLVSMLKPTVVILLSGVVTIIVFAVLLPLFSLMNGI